MADISSSPAPLKVPAGQRWEIPANSQIMVHRPVKIDGSVVMPSDAVIVRVGG